MGKFATLRVPDQIMIIAAVIIIVVAVSTMIIYSSDTVRKFLRRRTPVLIEKLEAFNEKFFSDDEPYNSEWMDEENWRKTRL